MVATTAVLSPPRDVVWLWLIFYSVLVPCWFCYCVSLISVTATRTTHIQFVALHCSRDRPTVAYPYSASVLERASKSNNTTDNININKWASENSASQTNNTLGLNNFAVTTAERSFSYDNKRATEAGLKSSRHETEKIAFIRCGCVLCMHLTVYVQAANCMWPSAVWELLRKLHPSNWV